MPRLRRSGFRADALVEIAGAVDLGARAPVEQRHQPDGEEGDGIEKMAGDE
jgi:hypothetical protein